VTWVVFSHSEIPIVALMTTFFLGRRLSNIQWVSIILLVDGADTTRASVQQSSSGCSPVALKSERAEWRVS
jgi:threonine/homoserine efflux transporter RhtA